MDSRLKIAGMTARRKEEKRIRRTSPKSPSKSFFFSSVGLNLSGGDKKLSEFYSDFEELIRLSGLSRNCFCPFARQNNLRAKELTAIFACKLRLAAV